MAVYCIGDIHGCYDEFRHLLEEMAFNPACDELLLTGDIIGRGPKPLDTVRFIRDLGDRATFVLGNHDLNFLAIAYGFKEPKRKDLLQDLLSSPDLEDIAEWFSRAPLVFRHPRVPVCLVHAGIIPEWSIEDALAMSREAEETLRQPVTRSRFLQRMFADTPDRWDVKYYIEEAVVKKLSAAGRSSCLAAVASAIALASILGAATEYVRARAAEITRQMPTSTTIGAPYLWKGPGLHRRYRCF